VLGFIAFLAHATTYLGYDIREKFIYLWYSLHLTSWAALLLAIVLAVREKDEYSFSQISKRGEWLALFFTLLVAYAVFNFMFTSIVLSEDGSPKVIDGAYVLFSHGKVIRKLNQDEYIRQKIYEARTESGHWMLFFTAAFGMLQLRFTNSKPSRTRVG
jgi:hypothetical protein